MSHKKRMPHYHAPYYADNTDTLSALVYQAYDVDEDNIRVIESHWGA